MQPLRLNITALKSGRPFRARRSGRLIDDVASASDSIRLSRRRMLGLSVTAGAAIGTAMPAMKALGATMLGELEIVGDEKRVAFRLGGRDRWVIDTARFGGTPVLKLRRNGTTIDLSLKNARFPGTDLPADLECEVRPGLFGRRMTIRMALGNFKCTVPLEQWLMGMSPARSIIAADLPVCPLGAGRLALKGSAEAELAPDWSLRFEGKGIARLRGIGKKIIADTALLSLPSRDDESLLADPPERRSLLTLERGEREWAMEPRIAGDDSWRFAARNGAFDLIHVESADTPHGGTHRVMLAEGNNPAAHLMVHPSPGLRGGNGAPFGLPLRDARYGIAFDPAGERASLVARFGTAPVWLHTPTASALLGDGEGAGLFELHGSNGVVEHAECIPALLSTFAPAMSPELISQPVKAEPGERVAFASAATAGPMEGLAGIVRFNPLDPDDPPYLSLKNLRVSIVRPEDLLVLDFEFVNMSLGSGPKPSLTASGGNAYIIAHFGPQNIGEEAFFEVDKKIPPAIPKNSDGSPHQPPDPDAGKTGDENPTPPPVKAHFSGPSRLVFKVPPGSGSIPYNLEELLDRLRRYALNVAPTAQPPKQPLNFAIVPGLFDKTLDVDSIFHLDTAKGGGFKARSSIPVSKLGTQKYVRSGGVKEGGDQAKKSENLVTSDASRVEKLIYEKRNLQRKATSGVVRYIGGMERVVDDKIKLVITKPELRKPTATETAIESPFRLIISPHAFSAWAHSPKPVVSQRTGRSELWHTRLAVRKEGELPDEKNSGYRTIRAIWARSNPPYDPSVPASHDQNNPESFNPEDPAGWPKHGNVPFRMSLDGFDRHNIVHLTANYFLRGYAREEIDPVPVSVERLMLTSLGAWMDMRGAWDKIPPGLAVEEWKHRAAMGRDTYVRVVYAGFLFPFGHRASLIKVTERKFQPHPSISGVKVAYLRQRMFIVVREPEKLTGVTNLKTDSGELYDLMMPFKRVKITTLVTPNLDDPAQSDYPDGMLQSTFWPRVGGKDFLFHLEVEDLDSQTAELTMPLQFIGKEITDKPNRSTIADIANRYETAGGDEAKGRRERPFSGQKVAFAASTKPGDTSFETDLVVFGAEVPTQTGYDKLPPQYPRFFPVVRKTKLLIPSIKHLVGNDSKAEVKFNTAYLKAGFKSTGGDDEKNPGEVFLEMLGGGIDLSFSSKGDKSGALMQPNMRISGLSRSMGPVAGDVETIRKGSFDPEQFFSALGAKLFGVIDLWDVVKAVGLDKGLDLVPKFVTEALSAVEGFMRDIELFKAKLDAMPGAMTSAANTMKGDIDTIINDITSFNPGALPGDLSTFVGHVTSMIGSIPTVAGFDPALRNDSLARLQQFKSTLSDIDEFVQKIKAFADAIEMAKEMKVKFEWRPELSPWGIDPGKPLFIPNDPRGLYVTVELRAKTDGKNEPSANVACGIDNFVLDLIAPLSFIKLHFKTIQFFMSTGKKADVNVELNEIEFVGVLSFVETLKDLIPLDGFSDPPALSVSEKGIDASFSLALPTVAVGVFSLQNMSLGAGFTVPFIGDPLSVRFNFCTRESPFILTVSMFGGGGFFGITLNPSGVQILEASFEFGASVAIDFGVASGGITVMAGIYFRMEKEGGKDNCSLTGYFRLHGEVDVLGLISASLTLELSLTYEFSSGKCVGRATLTIEVEVLFFSASVEISCERKFAGSKGDPSFEQLMGPYTDGGATVEPWREYCEAFDWK